MAATAPGELPTLRSARLLLSPFSERDVPALAAILAEPEVAKGITVDGSSPERCLAAARRRIAGYDANWQRAGYGVWAVRTAADGPAPPLIGWCGFAEPDVGDDPEILYGLAPSHWGRGLAREAAEGALDWLFGETRAEGVSAVVFGRINPTSAALLRRLGLKPCGTMAMSDFLPERDLAESVLDYEIWRLGHAPSQQPSRLLFEAPYKGGQIASLGLRDLAGAEAAFRAAARRRPDCAAIEPAELERQVTEAFRLGLAEPWLDHFHLSRPDRPAHGPA